MARLDAEERLVNFLPRNTAPGYGYQRGNQTPSARLASLPSLQRFEPWGPLRNEWFEDPPAGVKRQPDEQLYEGQRIIVARGVKAGFGPRARLAVEPFSFRHTIYCLPLHSLPRWQAETILGTLLSALGRYRLFMASGSWGVWHDSFVPDDILSLPMRMAGHGQELTRRISKAVAKLSEANIVGVSAASLFAQPDADHTSEVVDVLTDLDQAVFDLFELTGAERDLVGDFHRHTLPLVGRRTAWTQQPAIQLHKPTAGTIKDLTGGADVPMKDYLRAFLRSWNRELLPYGEFVWRVIASPTAAMLAVLFETRDVQSDMRPLAVEEQQRWHDVLDRLASSLGAPWTSSIRNDGTLRAVGDTTVVIAKRNEERLWTASTAREDAEATLLQAMALRGT